MSDEYYKTTMGKGSDNFRTTCWDILQAARTEDENQKQMVLDTLLNYYWKPVYCYLRRKGHSNESAKDLTQGFFLDMVLCRDIISAADKTKGRFRTFLLTALDNYTANIYHREHAQKRHPKGNLLSLEALEQVDKSMIPSGIQSDDVFNYIWASELLDKVLKRVESECLDTGKETHWKIFHDKVLASFLGSNRNLSLSEICEKHGVDDPTKASNMIVTVKRRFNSVLKQTLRMHVDSDDRVEEEFNELIAILSKSRAR